MSGNGGFRNNEIHFLQEQNNEVLGSLERVEDERDQAIKIIHDCEEMDARLQAELQSVRDKVGALGNRIQQDRTEAVAKDEHVKVLSEQNKQMLQLLEAEEAKSRDNAERIRNLEAKNRKLQRIAEEFDVAKGEIEKQVADAKTKAVDVIAGVKNQRGLNETLRANIQNTEAKTRVDIEALGQAMQVVDQRNLEHLQRINKQEAKEKQLQSENEALKQQVEKVREDIDELRKQLEGDTEGRTGFERQRGQIESSIEGDEVAADTLKKALNTAERANEQLQDENRTSAERCRETADKVYALMDSLRMNQVELKKQEAENGARDKKVLSLERQIQALQAKIAMETDAKVLAEQERKEAEQEATVLKKKNKKLEESSTQSQLAQEKAEHTISEVNERVSGLQTQNAYLASRIDGQEEEKNAAKAEIKKVADRTTELNSQNSRLRDDIERLEEQVATASSEKQNFTKELEYIKREDVLDDAGRLRPVLIQSTESDLLEKLQVNEFLYEAQQARNPVPPLIEKVAQLLAMLHEGQTRADQYLGDVSKCNSLVSALRQRNVALFTKTQQFESFKTRALIKYVMNLVEGDLMSELHLDGLSFGPREINEMINLLQQYEATEKVFVISFIDNSLDEGCINLLMQIAFMLPYLRSLDLRRNCISQEGIVKIEDELRKMEGVTTVIRTANQVLNVHSGNQLRLCLDVSEQMPKEQVQLEADFAVRPELSADEVDPFLATDRGGFAQHPWMKSASAQNIHSPMKAIPDPSSVELGKTSGGVTALVTGGPPVGLGGPGNLSALNKKAGRKAGGGAERLPAPKNRQARRAKAAPVPALEYQPDERVVDKWQSGVTAVLCRSSSRRSGSQRSTDSRRDSSDKDCLEQFPPPDYRRTSGAPSKAISSCGLDRARSMPALRANTVATAASGAVGLRRPPPYRVNGPHRG